MIAPVISMVLALLAGFVVAMGWSALRAAFGKDNRTIVLIALLAATTLSGLAAEILIHHPSFGVMFLMSSAAFINYQEVRAEGTRLDALTALFRQSVASALATRVVCRQVFLPGATV